MTSSMTGARGAPEDSWGEQVAVTTKLKAGVLGIEGAGQTDRWYVTNGATAVGPVHLDLIARGIENGQVPMEAFLRHDTWKVWRPLSDFAVVVEPSLDEPVTDDTPLPRFTLASANDALGTTRSDLRGLATEDHDAVVRESEASDPEIPISFEEAAASSEALRDDELEVLEALESFDVDMPSSEGRALNASGSWPLCTGAWAPAPLDIPALDIPALEAAQLDQLAQGATRSQTANESLEQAANEFDVEAVWAGEPVSGIMPARALQRFNPPPPDLTDDITAPARPLRRDERIPEDALAGAADLQDALLLTLAEAVDVTSSDAAILHRVDDDGALVVCAHGPEMLSMLGARTRLLDAAIVAAAAASTVVAEPTPGIAGEAIIERLARLGIVAEGAFMVPIRPHGRLLALLEVGRTSPYRALDVAEVEKLVDALVGEIEAKGWSAPASATGSIPAIDAHPVD